MSSAHSSTEVIRRQALCLRQHPTLPLYIFSLLAADVPRVTDVSRIGRDDEGDLVGYQRPAVRRHIKNIVDYLDGSDVLFPNSLILAFSSAVRFVEHEGIPADKGQSIGHLEIPIPLEDHPRPGWIVDGQQRSRALAMTRREDLIVPVTAFVTDDIGIQRDQFLRINSVKPLPNGLITELLPTLDTPLPAKLEARKVPSMLCDRLARDTTSPFAGLIRRASTPRSERKHKVVTDTALVKTIQDSLSSPSGCLFPHRNVATGEVDTEAAWSILHIWWTAVRNTFPDAWGRPPRESRLMHSAGIRAMGALMDRVMPGIDASSPESLLEVETELAPLRSVCRWTQGRWTELDGIAWNELQCVARHIRALSEYLADVHARHAYTSAR